MTFPLGRICITPGVLRLFPEYGSEIGALVGLLRRHATGDWGELDAEDTAANNRAVAEGTRIHSVYTLQLNKPVRLYIMTEGDRSATTILLPDEY